MGAFLNLLIFSKISGLCQMYAQPRNLLEKYREVFKSNLLTVMYDLKRHIKAEYAKKTVPHNF